MLVSDGITEYERFPCNHSQSSEYSEKHIWILKVLTKHGSNVRAQILSQNCEGEVDRMLLLHKQEGSPDALNHKEVGYPVTKT